MNKIALIATSLSFATLAPLAAFAAAPIGQDPAPLNQVLATPQAQRDPLAAVAQAGYEPGSEVYEAVANTIAENVPANSPYFTKDVNNQVAILSQSEEEGMTE